MSNKLNLIIIILGIKWVFDRVDNEVEFTLNPTEWFASEGVEFRWNSPNDFFFANVSYE